jgi:hypothetical protein
MTRRYLRDRTWGTEPRAVPLENVPRTENEETRRKARDWLRDRGEQDSLWFDEGERELCV